IVHGHHGWTAHDALSPLAGRRLGWAVAAASTVTRSTGCSRRARSGVVSGTSGVASAAARILAGAPRRAGRSGAALTKTAGVTATRALARVALAAAGLTARIRDRSVGDADQVGAGAERQSSQQRTQHAVHHQSPFRDS